MKREAQNCTFPLCVAAEGTWLQVAAVLKSAGPEDWGGTTGAAGFNSLQGTGWGFPSLVEAFLLSLLFGFNFLYFRAGIYLGLRRERTKAPVLLSR